MVRPTTEQLATALEEARRLRESGTDDRHIGHCLLYLDRRVHVLEQVLDRARHFLHAGYAAPEHRALVKAIEQAERQALGGEDDESRVYPW